MPYFKTAIFSSVVLLTASYSWSAPPLDSQTSQIVKQKFSKLVEKVPLDDKHPAIIAANKISDSSDKEAALESCQLFQEELNLIIGWLVHEVPEPQKIFNIWENLPSQDRPFLTAGKLWKQETINIEKLEDYLKVSWRGSPLLIRDDYHVVTVKLQKNDEKKEISVDFYDPYEPFEEGSFLERRILETLEYKAFQDYEVKFTAHYSKSQKLAAFGECTLYASVYRSALLKGESPETFSQETIVERVSFLKGIVRDQHPEYFQNYDKIFQFLFDSKLADYLLEEIQKLPRTWGIDSKDKTQYIAEAP